MCLGYADKLTGDEKDVLKLRPGITGPSDVEVSAGRRNDL